jgi:hypothetical protein
LKKQGKETVIEKTGKKVEKYLASHPNLTNPIIMFPE